MTPLRLDGGGRDLFAIHHPARAGHETGDAMLMCNPYGHEAIRAHRLYRVLGERLAAAGVHVLRFDYHGSGDSSGDDADFDLAGALADTLIAAAELRRRSGAARLSLLGLRLGALVAQRAAATLEVDRLVQLEPIGDGARYLAQLAAAHEAELGMAFGRRWGREPALRARNRDADGAEVLGFALSASCRGQIVEALREPSLPRSRLALVVSDDDAVRERWAGVDGARCVASASEVDWTTSDSLNATLVPPAWIELVLRTMAQEGARA